MSKYLIAKEVVENSFWIVERKGSKIGTLRHKTEGYVFYENNSRTETVLDNLNDFKFEKQKQKKTVNADIFGYPTNVDTVYNEQLQDTVPVYTKTATSQQYFVAGYWGVLFPHGWRPSFCPRLKTLQDYTHIGPFTNEADMYLAMKRRVQQDEKNIRFTTTRSTHDSTSTG